MAANGIPAAVLFQPSVPVFTGKEYGRWSLRIKTVFKSQELWDLVKKGLAETKEEAQTAHEAWEVLKKQYHGTSKALEVRLQALRQGFETLQMEDHESIQEYFSRVVTTVNQIKGLGHKLSEAEVVSKVLRSLVPKFDFVVVAIKESKELASLSLYELRGSLQAHEVRVNRALGKSDEKVLLAKGETSSSTSGKGVGLRSPWGDGRGRGRQFNRGRGRGRDGRGRSLENKSQV
ncbi:uncharacterized protein LOC120276070 [Dioscorea cayenensis subsp. rotundata]|uniref:Uncharacterized protein LOC120276070 n=1 Tax=Dioscorea cayennensis subsp. rotundata TaxID=55577 RepID=A0AB40CFN1_DIOCR|nr:uncharacterized protein LOC120276070 [Dioscorea cayenensis subsp. rotundata]